MQKTLLKFLDKNIHYLISFSAGVFLVVSGSLVVESWHLLESLTQTILFIVIGFVISWLIVYLLPEIHHHHDECCVKNKHKVIKIIIGSSIHNIADGLVLVSAFSISNNVGLVLGFSILVHELLQETSKFFILHESGYSVKKAITINFLTSLTIFIGVGLGFLLNHIEQAQGIILALSSGFFLNIVLSDLLPHNYEENRQILVKKIGVLLLGLIIMFSVLFLFSHSHNHKEHHNENSHYDYEHH
ncbi:Zinc transporter, ZIP family [hydrothermal vent metagenome]|uniref:Zinc transporter, ZIP family n=1 Tax=hydrothermal vent metagenome TaxID=652676 RepID=A0A1W1BQK7_9ZZZZ